MKILVVNCGSSSIKYKLYEMENHSVIAAGGIEKVGIEGSFLKVTLPDGTKRVIEHECPTHSEGIRLMFKTLLDPEIGAIKSLDEISAAGHRIVAGGIFTKSQIVSDEMIEQWKPFMELAPLHSEAHLKGYLAVKEQLPDLPQVFVFDTAFHQTMPPKAYMYALPYRYYSEMRIRRYGAHGTSHQYVSGQVARLMGNDALRQIVLHLGNGASVSAVKAGRPIDTSMGLTPLEGLVMGTRTGDIDPAVVFHLQRQTGWSADEVDDLFNKQSGLKGLTGENDMRAVRHMVDSEDPEVARRARLALDIYVTRIIKYIGSYTAELGGLDVITFTAGIGENDADLRREVCERLLPFGVRINDEVNNQRFSAATTISTDDSSVTVMVVPTNEELAIARQALTLI